MGTFWKRVTLRICRIWWLFRVFSGWLADPLGGVPQSPEDVAAAEDDTDAGALRDSVDRLKDKLGESVVVLACATQDGKVRLAAGVSKATSSRIKAGIIFNHPDYVFELRKELGRFFSGEGEKSRIFISDNGMI